ncbi:MAG: hypothetical protein Q8L85_07515 [Alphaproteobacteria bacterium]|nr:hypothetical protein [Alphaproteobacteria bacterium]
MSITNLIKISLLSLVLLSKMSFAIKINGEEVIFPDGASDKHYVIKSYQSPRGGAWAIQIHDDEVTLSSLEIVNMPELVQSCKENFEKIDSGDMQPSYSYKNLSFKAASFNFEKTLLIAEDKLNMNAGGKINIQDSIADVGGICILKALQMNFKNMIFRTENSVVLENKLEGGAENWLKAIEVFSHNIDNVSFLRLDGSINFEEPSIPGKFMVFGANKISIVIKKLDDDLLQQPETHGINTSTNVIDLPTGFDALCYLHMYQDLYDHAQTLSSDEEKRKFAITHYLTSGESEGRKYFDPFAYLYLYEDLYNAAEKLSTDDEKRTFAIWHFLTFAKNEGRKYLEILPENFDASCYLYYYEDLYYVAETLSSDEDKKKFALKHYLRYGKSEGRKYFNPFTYLRLNQDLYDFAQTLSSNEEKRKFAINHYLTHGKKESRKFM